MSFIGTETFLLLGQAYQNEIEAIEGDLENTSKEHYPSGTLIYQVIEHHKVSPTSYIPGIVLSAYDSRSYTYHTVLLLDSESPSGYKKVQLSLIQMIAAPVFPVVYVSRVMMNLFPE